ncbi:MAG TPA: hypothetical protein GXX66_03255 [Acholeplasmataceae bacterium]|nr:hypothetical protein [Acholeplasmataceae bacterium]
MKEKVLDFFKSLVIPIKMARYKYMSVLIAVLIFVAASVVTVVPVNYNYEHSNYSWIESNNVLALQYLTKAPISDNEVDENNVVIGKKGNLNEVLEDFYDLKLLVKKNEDSNTWDLVKENGEFDQDERHVFKMQYKKDDVETIHINLYVDLFNKTTDHELAEKDKLKIVPYRDFAEREDMPAKYPEFRAESYSWKDDSGNVKLENYISIVLNTDAIHYVIDFKALNENGDVIDIADQFQSKRFWNNDYLYSYKDYEGYNSQQFFDYIARIVVLGYARNAATASSFWSFVYTFIYPLVIVFLIWILFRKQGQLKKFKEYYNIAAITSLIPIIVVFIVSWFWPNILSYYVIGFAVYYLFIIAKINNYQEVV